MMGRRRKGRGWVKGEMLKGRRGQRSRVSGEEEEEVKCWILNEEENGESAFFYDPRSIILSYLFASIRDSKL
jgi:hypothetical protein